MSPFNTILDRFGRWLARRLETDVPSEAPYIPTDRHALRRTLRTGDVLLIAGSSTISTAIKYLTQSTWSHAALYVGDVLGQKAENGEPHVLIEVTATAGCVSIPLSRYERYHTRICRPVGLTDADREAIATYLLDPEGTRILPAPAPLPDGTPMAAGMDHSQMAMSNEN